ncbi:MAG: membrane protein insertion efficiency factor YidD [Flavobacteriaceae bacterium]|nr:membrane protein insertion efficiency factor YidD [Flavobacteriaceae bacterium]|tara:strand:- start:12899 stop:13129 length:231 start_codon:yes stop_codon:yes gene_type:complete
MKWIKYITNAPFLFLIGLYQKLISPILGPKCRFTPTCSAYSVESIKKYGIFKGVWLSANRIIKCHPWGSSGYDPVP